MTLSAPESQYAALYAYLKGRYADLVVLTFAEIEDLTGFSLPAPARVNADWWSNDRDDDPAAQSRVWLQASRRATPNLFARTVAFERVG
ncbi:MAG TPA: hypothetical protein VGI12_19865 [Vicinamibacterales bacterium]|jgi:hypothetical protein